MHVYVTEADHFLQVSRWKTCKQLFFCRMYACTAIDCAAIGMWRIYLNENLLEAYPSGCNELVELLLRKQIYRGQSERLQIWIQTNPAATDNFRQHSLWQVTFITCADITGQHGERELHGCCHSVHCIYRLIICPAETQIQFSTVQVQHYFSFVTSIAIFGEMFKFGCF